MRCVYSCDETAAGAAATWVLTNSLWPHFTTCSLFFLFPVIAFQTVGSVRWMRWISELQPEWSSRCLPKLEFIQTKCNAMLLSLRKEWRYASNIICIERQPIQCIVLFFCPLSSVCINELEHSSPKSVVSITVYIQQTVGTFTPRVSATLLWQVCRLQWQRGNFLTHRR